MAIRTLVSLNVIQVSLNNAPVSLSLNDENGNIIQLKHLWPAVFIYP